MIVIVEYAVPVLCYVDTDAGEVIKIVVDDETMSRGDDVYDEGFEDLVDEPTRSQAVDIAEHQAWPSWNTGF